MANLYLSELIKRSWPPVKKARGDSYIWHIRVAEVGPVVNGMPRTFALADIASSLSGHACRLKD
jgi:hypothetical protein